MIGKLKRNKPNKSNISDNATNSSRELLEKTTCPSRSTLSWTKLQEYRKTDNRFKFRKTEEKCHSDSELIIRKKTEQTKAAQETASTAINYQIANRYKWDKNSPTKCKTSSNVLQSTSVSNHTVVSKFKLVKKNIHNDVEITHRKVPNRTINRNTIRDISKTVKNVPNVGSNNTYNTFPKYPIDILSKYKVVRRNNSDSQKVTQRKDSSNLFVWKKQDLNTDILIDEKEKLMFQLNKDSFIRRRYSVMQKTNAAQMRLNLTAYNQPASYIRNHRDSFASRRLRYVKTRLPAAKPIKTNNMKLPQKDLILSRHGTHYKVAGNFRSLRRLSTPKESKPKQKSSTSKLFVKQSKFKFQRSNSVKLSLVKQKVASQVLKRSLTQAQRKKVNQTKFCLFYNRFGKCKRGDQCKYIHDPEKVAVCTRFLRGTCKDEKCLFSHKIEPKKMPVCSYFLLGQCSKDSCPYRHVNVSETASICEDFLKGYCPREEKCTKKHVLQCIEFNNTGKCQLGKKCPLIHHVKKGLKRRRSSSISGARKPKAFRQKKIKDDNSTISEHTNEQSPLNLLTSPLRNAGKLKLVPKFISEKINASNNYEQNKQPSFSAMRNLFNFDGRDSNILRSMDVVTNILDHPIQASSSRGNQEDFLPLGISSDSDSEHEHLSRTFSFKEQDFIALD